MHNEYPYNSPNMKKGVLLVRNIIYMYLSLWAARQIPAGYTYSNRCYLHLICAILFSRLSVIKLVIKILELLVAFDLYDFGLFDFSTVH